ncbi:MAG: acvB [Collimonas fungivorans]|uniref:AcvB/VirJ family lysyl-phosphatidylglycerol hydrolase n=1 Tax=Collimonas fungivorans TaxID=158899 RepID=UPI0026F2788C|nr:AcvB/VirJ family lysyl-phosphatidylglycerol hydrolase [Collimonas fungivorans]MDB5768150.1 acvB [Collimonas fungivorans]
MKQRIICLALCAMAFIGSAASADDTHHSVSHGRFKSVEIYRPAGPVNGVVLLLSGDAGWNQGAAEKARALAQQGALVAGISTPQLFASLDADGGDCAFPDGDLENLSRFVQAYEKVPGYYPPLLVGEGSGASFAYAMLAQAPAGTFGGAISLGFCPALSLRKPLCKGEGVRFKAVAKGKGVDLLPVSRLPAAWRVLLDGQTPKRCDARVTRVFVASVGGAELVQAAGQDGLAQLKSTYASLNAKQAVAVQAPPAAVSDLPVVEVAALAPSGRNPDADTMVILISGDGGWAGIDRDVANALSKRGVPVVGVDSLRYFWSVRTPASTAKDVERLMQFYMARWKKSKVVLIGYSQGADVLPFVGNRLSAKALASVPLIAMMGLGKKADFQFHLTNWVSSSNDGLPIPPEVAKLPAGLAMCIYGSEETDSACPSFDAGRVKLLKLHGGHHFDGNYERLAGLILDAARK